MALVLVVLAIALLVMTRRVLRALWSRAQPWAVPRPVSTEVLPPD